MLTGWKSLWKRIMVDTVVIALAAVIAVFAFDNVSALFSRGAPRANPAALMGASVTLKGSHLNDRPLSVVIVASPTCIFCQQSAPFYKTVWDRAQKTGVLVYVALPSPGDAREYLKSAGLDRAILTTWTDLGVTVDGTPTILMVDRAKVIRRSWLGLLDKDKTREVLELISNPNKVSQLVPDNNGDVMTESELQSRLKAVDSVSIIDIRERDQYAHEHRSGAVNIPFDELYIRMHFELKPSQLQVIDCVGVKPKECRFAADVLRKNDFPVKLLATDYTRQS